MQCSNADIPHMRFFELGQIFQDFGCLSTNIICGRNMAFYTIEEENTSNSIKCWQRCSCLDKKYVEISGKCIEKPFMDTNENLQVNIFENTGF